MTYILLSLIFLSASFDVFLNLQIAGFSFRIVYLFESIFILFSFITLLKEKRFNIKFNRIWIFLLIWIILQSVSLIFSPYLLRSTGYFAWLILNSVFIYFLYLWMDAKRLNPTLKLYFLSFGVIAIFGLVQFFLPLIGLPSPLVAQWWQPNYLARINGFSYEPSYFAAYMIPGLVYIILSYFNKDYSILNKKRLLITGFLILSAVVLSTSRMGILSIILIVFYLIARLVISLLFKKNAKEISMKSIGMILVVIIGGIVLLGAPVHWNYKKYIAGFGLSIAENAQDTGSRDERLSKMKDTLNVVIKNPVFGVSIGGVAGEIAKNYGQNIASNYDIKQYEGMNVFLEVLAGSGITGFISFALFFIFIIAKLWKQAYKGENVLIRSISEAALVALILEMFLLIFNQNILRPYFWVQLGITLSIIQIYEKSGLPKGEL